MIEITNPECIGDTELKYTEAKELGNIMIQSSGFLRYVVFEDIILKIYFSCQCIHPSWIFLKLSN